MALLALWDCTVDVAITEWIQCKSAKRANQYTGKSAVNIGLGDSCLGDSCLGDSCLGDSFDSPETTAVGNAQAGTRLVMQLMLA